MLAATYNASNYQCQQQHTITATMRGANTGSRQKCAVSSTTSDAINHARSHQHNKRRQRQRTMPAIADDATDNKRRWHNGPSQQQRTMPAITNDRSNNTSCQQPRAMPIIISDSQFLYL